MESNKPKVLMFADWYLPGYKAGGPISSCANMVALLGDSIEFKIVTSDRDYLDTEPYPSVDVDTWCSVGKAQVLYLPPAKQTLAIIKKLIVENEDCQIYINGFFSKSFSILPLIAARGTSQKVILAPRGMLAPGALGIKSRKKKVYLAIAKKFGFLSGIHFHATDTNEAKHIRQNISVSNIISIIPNLPSARAGSVSFPLKEPNQIKILSVARIAREKNTLFAVECLRKIPANIQVELQWIGPVYDSGYIEKCKKAAATLPANVSVSFPGSVPPSKLDAYYQDAHLFFLPTLGENYGHAIIESMLAGTPALISDQTPWKNLESSGLGADLPLFNSIRFSDFIIQIARMNNSEYIEKFDHIAEKAAERIHLNDTIKKYKALFS